MTLVRCHACRGQLAFVKACPECYSPERQGGTGKVLPDVIDGAYRCPGCVSETCPCQDRRRVRAVQ